MMSNLLTFATIDLPDTIKAALIRLIARFIQTKQPSNSIMQRAPQALGRCFRQLVDNHSLNNYEAMLQAFAGRKFIGIVVLKGRGQTNVRHVFT